MCALCAHASGHSASMKTPLARHSPASRQLQHCVSLIAAVFSAGRTNARERGGEWKDRQSFTRTGKGPGAAISGACMALPPPSPEQEVALAAWRAGRDQVVTAAAGSGKSTLLLHACACVPDEDVVVIAYNKPLATDMVLRLAEAGLHRARCFTFHGLASHVYRLTPDDVTMHEVVSEVESGALRPATQVRATRICLDEVQDMRNVFHRLLATIFDLRAVQWLLVGDPAQMLYDYDDEDPALLEFCQTPERHFRNEGEWVRSRLSVSFRLTPPVVTLANALLHDSASPIVAGNADPEPPAPRVITSSNWEWAAVVVPLGRGLVLQNGLQLHQITLLARSVRADTNRPLAILINALAHAGCPVYVHGVDGPNDRVQRGKLRVCTWHASKGTQNTAVIVLGVDGDSQHNPLHVALTRSRRHVFVLHDRRKQHIGMVRAAKTLECVDADTHTLRSTADQQIDLHAPGSVALAPRVLRNLEAWSPRGRCTRVHNLLRGAAPAPPPALAGAEALVDEVLVQVHGLWEDVTAVYMLAALLCAEQCDENQCKRVRDMVAPTRASRDTLRVELERGNDVRFLDVRVRDEEALPTSARRELRAKAAPDCDGAAGVRWCTLAVCASAWGRYHHATARLLPVEWSDEALFGEILRRVRAVQVDRRDVLLTTVHEECLLYTRAHAIAGDTAWSFIYADGIGRAAMLSACVPLAFGEQLRVAAVLNVRTGEVARFERQGSASELLIALLR